MDASLQPLLDRAFGVADATTANAAIAEAREAAGADRPTSYEVLVKDGQSLADLANAIVPRLVYHLESLGARPPRWGEVFLSLFVGARLHFVHAADAMPVLLAELKLTPEEALARFGTGELRHAVELKAESKSESKPLLLGTGPSNE